MKAKYDYGGGYDSLDMYDLNKDDGELDEELDLYPDELTKITLYFGYYFTNKIDFDALRSFETDISKDYNITFDDIQITNTERKKLKTKVQTKYYLTNLTYAKMQEVVTKNKRISDINNAEEENRDAIYSIYSKGIMTGYSNGSFSTSRKFCPSLKSTLSEAELWISRVAGKKAKRKFSPEGMLIRSENLPFNAKEWKYLLEDVPNEFYQMRYEYEGNTGNNMSNLNKIRDEAILPNKFCNEYHTWPGIEIDRLNDIVKSVEKTLNLQLNVSYKTIDKEWAEEFYKSVSDHIDLFEMSTTKKYYKNGKLIKTYRYTSKSVFTYYIKFVKKYKVTIQADKIYVDPNSIYIGDKFTSIRSYVRFKVNWKGKIMDVDRLVFPGDCYSSNLSRNYLTGLEKGKYIECMMDTPIDLNVPSKYLQSASYGGVETGYLKSMKFLTTKNYYGYIYIKTKQLIAVKKPTGGGGTMWVWK